MKIKNNLLKTFTLLLTTTLAMFQLTVARADSADSQKLQRLLDGIHSMKGNFTQTVYNGKGKAIKTVRGTMMLSRPGLFRWETRSPTQQNVIDDGKKLWIYDIDLKQVRVKRASSSNSPAEFLSGSSKAKLKNFTIEADGDTYNLKARFKTNPFTNVQLRFSGNKLTGMSLSDNLGQKSVVNFSNLQTNSGVPKDAFTFSPPPGVDVVKE